MSEMSAFVMEFSFPNGTLNVSSSKKCWISVLSVTFVKG